ncbi:MAG: hypothetical protein OEY89_18065, partial [Gammaproteobacteria bacterium]|nr:hypothetical protein [Gammaproteobacteria bacterium]
MATARKRRSRKGKATGTAPAGLSHGQSSLAVFLAGSIILIAVAFFSQYPTISQLNEQQGTIATSVAERVAYKLALNVAHYSQTLGDIARDPQIRDLIISNDLIAIEIKADELKKRFTGALRIRLLASGIYTQDKTTEPHLGFACLDMQREAEKA